MTANLKDLEQQVMVITGATSGIGLATTLLASERGAKLVLVARGESTLKAIVDQIEDDGGQALACVADVADERALRRAADMAVARFGRIDTWVNNAGVSVYGRIDQVGEGDARRVFDTNYWGVVNGSLAALPHLRAHGGALINLGSEVSDAAIPLQGVYVASKHAVKGFTDALRLEIEHVDRAPVSITLIQPTAVDTPFPLHARNYMAQEAKLPDPQIDPYQVAEAILEAATRGGRDYAVGAVAKMNIMMARLAPKLADRLAAHQADRQQEDRPAPDRRDALYGPGIGGYIYGSELKSVAEATRR